MQRTTRYDSEVQRLPSALVIGFCKHGLYLTRNLTDHGIPVYVIEKDFSQPSARTRHGKKIHCPDLHGDALLETLFNLKKRIPSPVAVFAANDRMVDFLLRHYNELADHYRFPFPPGDVVLRLKDKARLHTLALEAGLNVPRSYVVCSVDELERIRDGLHFPVAVKPALPMMSFKSRCCRSYHALCSQVVASEKLDEALIIQEWIDGDDRAIYFGAYYIAPDGHCPARYGGRKLMSYPPLTGHAAATESWDIGSLMEEGLSFLRRNGYWGLASIEYKGRTPSQAGFIEVTVGRSDWWIMCCGINGVNIPMAAYNDMMGQDVPFANCQRADYIWHDLECELPVLAEIVAKRQWTSGEIFNYLRRPKKEALFDWADLKPFLAFVLRYAVWLSSRLFHRLRMLRS